MGLSSSFVDQRSSSQSKITLFRSLFRGRDDVYPRRFESRKTGKSGYAPACANEWVRGVCEKPRMKCAECPNRRFLPVTDDVIRWHLSGCDPDGQPFVAGVYPLLQDETCFFLAVDFDKADWRDDTTAFLDTCRHLDLPAVLERSRSGRGAHVWFFFQEAISAALARRLGSHVLTETMEARPDLGLDSYDRLFPNQDTMPQRGFGNLIALPLQKGPRNQNNSVFIDDRFVPWSDQWAFLASVRKMGRAQVEGIVQEAERRGRILGVRLPPQEDGDEAPWTATPSRHRKEPPIVGELPHTLEFVLGNQIYVAKEGLHPGLRNRLLRLAAFQNPEFYKAQAMRLSTYDKPRVIACAEDHPHHIGLPRGCLNEVRQVLSDVGVRLTMPGWPADVVLPSDPVWKRDYSGSVRRLVRDDVDTPLATLFAHAARTVPSDADGADRARSATEAFLYRRLETLAETKGRFRVNVALPIPFDGSGQLEVDLLCADARGRGVGRGPASRGSSCVSPRPPQRSVAAGERLLRVAVSC